MSQGWAMPSSELVFPQMNLQVQLISKSALSSSVSPATPDGLLPNLVEKERGNQNHFLVAKRTGKRIMLSLVHKPHSDIAKITFELLAPPRSFYGQNSK